MSERQRALDTRLIHHGEPEPRFGGAVSMPVFQSSTFEYAGESSYHDLRYIRLNNTPNHVVLHAKLADAEHAEAALVAASGMAAITTTLLSVLSAGDHLLAQDCLYGGCHSFVTQDLARYGVAVTLVDGARPDQWASALRPQTKAFYVETISNPLMAVPDLRAAAEFARAHGLLSIVDNTFASPVNFRPAELGLDLSLHSGTKYLNGHTDIVAGAIIGRAELVERVGHMLDHLGGSLDPHACFLLHRGLKTLALRVRQQNRSAQAVAAALAEHPAVARVNYPGLPSHPQHAIARELFDGFGGMLSVELAGGVAAAQRMVERVQIPIVAPSLGGVESLITLPALTSHAGMSAEERRAAGIGDGLVRISVGIEDTEDLLADLTQALSA